jgi:hypothetical protein
VSAVVLNIAIGLATSVVSGACVWLWQRGRNARILRRKATLFGLRPGGTCLIVLTSRYDKPGTTSHDDVYAAFEVATLAYELACPISVRSCEDMRESNGNRTEFCIGGPDSNPRTRGHLASHLPGVTVRSYHPSRRDSIAIVVGDHLFLRDPEDQEYALVAKFTPQTATRPVIIICGQTGITNRAAMHFLKCEYREVAKTVTSTDQFCIIIRVASPGTYGYQAASLERDVSAAAFAGH